MNQVHITDEDKDQVQIYSTRQKAQLDKIVFGIVVHLVVTLLVLWTCTQGWWGKKTPSSSKGKRMKSIF